MIDQMSLALVEGYDDLEVVGEYVGHAAFCGRRIGLTPPHDRPMRDTQRSGAIP
jgi:hypothetical protein